jgi:hypothetical protein
VPARIRFRLFLKKYDIVITLRIEGTRAWALVVARRR